MSETETIGMEDVVLEQLDKEYDLYCPHCHKGVDVEALYKKWLEEMHYKLRKSRLVIASLDEVKPLPTKLPIPSEFSTP